jgi:hypothetical protein
MQCSLKWGITYITYPCLCRRPPALSQPKLQIPDSVPVPKTTESTSRILISSVPTVIPKKVIVPLCHTLWLPPSIDAWTFRWFSLISGIDHSSDRNIQRNDVIMTMKWPRRPGMAKLLKEFQINDRNSFSYFNRNMRTTRLLCPNHSY